MAPIIYKKGALLPHKTNSLWLFRNKTAVLFKKGAFSCSITRHCVVQKQYGGLIQKEDIVLFGTTTFVLLKAKTLPLLGNKTVLELHLVREK